MRRVEAVDALVANDDMDVLGVVPIIPLAVDPMDVERPRAAPLCCSGPSVSMTCDTPLLKVGDF